MPNVICTPHLGYVTREEYETQFIDIFDQILAYAAGKPINVINTEVLSHTRVEKENRNRQRQDAAGLRYVLGPADRQELRSRFSPELTPAEMLPLGVFGGKYMTDCPGVPQGLVRPGQTGQSIATRR